ncbi:DUF3006 domain-containing protein [Haloplanus sp. C73]|uniref:DUF3006 domain-containing protein n=1 Tax=Haloplanus sp. C73 TaxID=3421641 RepID=UPI003EBE9643
MTETDVALANGTYTAVVDAIEDGQARVFIEQDNVECASLVLSADELPEPGRHADAVFTVVVTDGALAEWEYDPDATQARRAQAQSRFDQLSRRLSGDDDS